MKKLTDSELIDELDKRFKENEKGCAFTVSIPEGEEEPELGSVSDDGNEFIFEGAEEF